MQSFDTETSKTASMPVSFSTFSLGNALLATAACNFSTSELRKVVWSWRVLYIFTGKRTSRHSGVQFLISPLTTWLRTRRFNEPTLRLSRHTNHWKNTAFPDFSNIWRGWIFFLLTFAPIASSFFLRYFICFSTLHIVGSLLFKLPSIVFPNALDTNSETNIHVCIAMILCKQKSLEKTYPFQVVCSRAHAL